MPSGNLAAAAVFFAAIGERAARARHEGVARAAELIEAKAKAALGTYEYDWPELAEATQENRVRLGFPANEPELMTGKLRDSIGHVAEGDQAVVGSTEKTAVYAELGTSRAPPRPIFASAVIQNLDAIKEAIGAPFHAALTGKSLDHD